LYYVLRVKIDNSPESCDKKQQTELLK